MKRKTFKNNQEFVKYAVFFFVFILAYSFIIINHFGFWNVDRHIYSYYLTDYSFGFCSRFFMGAVYHLFFKEVVVWQLTLFLTILQLVFFVFLSLLLAKVITAQEAATDRNRLLVLFCFFLTGPSTFSSLCFRLGIYDIFLYIFALAMVVFVSNKYLKFLIPVLCVLCILVHFSSVVSFIIFFCLLLWYEALHKQGKDRVIMVVLLVFCALLSIGLTVYFVVCEGSNLTYSLEEFDKQLLARNRYPKESGNIDIDYFNSVLYKEIVGERFQDNLKQYFANPWIDAGTTSLPKVLVNAINLTGGYFQYVKWYFLSNKGLLFSTAALSLLVCCPLLFIFYSYWVRQFKRQKGFFAKVLFLLIMLQYPLAISGLLLSTDLVRWLMHGFVLQFVLFIYILYKEKEVDYLKQTVLFRADYRYCLCYFICYALMVFDPLT